MNKILLAIVGVLAILLIIVVVFMALNAALTVYNIKSGEQYDPNRQQSISAAFLSSSQNNQREPAISGSKVVWSENINGYWQIVLYDLKDNSRHQLTSDSFDHGHPIISGDLVIWGQSKSDEPVAGVNYATGQVISLPVLEVYQPAIDGSKLVALGKIDTSSNNTPVFLFDIETKSAEILVRSRLANWSAVSGNMVVWDDWRNGSADIYGYNLLTKQELSITDVPGDQEKPDISGEMIVWQDNRNATGTSNNHDIYAYSLKDKREFVISARGGDEVDPKISGNIMTWTDYVGSYVDVYAYDLRTQTLITIAANDHANAQPSLFGTTVVWTQWETANRDAHSQIMIGQIP